jgi:hypothetical protein
METVINQLQKIPLSGDQILDAVDNKTKIIRYPDLHKYNTIEDVLHPYNCAVILYESKPRYGHWVCIMLHPDNTLEWFDPYGFSVDEEFKFINADYRKATNQYYPAMCRLFLNSPYHIVINKMEIQKYEKDNSSCGRHCVFRLISRHLPLEQYQQLMKKENNMNADDKITLLTAYL